MTVRHDETKKQNTLTHDNSTEAQRKRLLDALSRKAMSTIEARRDLDILHPAGRVKELRDQGHEITTVWSKEPTDCGKLHRVARYVICTHTGGK